MLISVDMEGVAGVAAPEDVTPGQPHYERNCGYMTGEANAAVLGVLAADPDASVVVVDGHANFRNIVPDRLDRRCTLLRGSARPLTCCPVSTAASTPCVSSAITDGRGRPLPFWRTP